MWRGQAAAEPAARAARRVTVAAAVLFVLLMCRGRPWDFFDVAGFSNDFYDAQARAFWHLRLDVPADVPGPEGFLIDGKTYLYYGPFLALLRLPVVLLGDWVDGRFARLSMVVALVLACTAAFHLLRRVQRALGPDSPVSPRRAGLFVGLVAASPVLALAGWVSVYHETELWAFALFLWTVVALLDVLHRPTVRGVHLAGLAATACVLTRASVGIGALFAVGLVGLVWWRRRERALAVRGVAWGVSGLVLNSLLNLAKFGTLLDLPADRQLLTLQSPARAAWFAGNGGSFFSPRFLPTTVVQYLRPDAFRLERLVPFVKFGPNATEYGSYPLEGNTASSSLTVAATGLCVLAVAGAVLAVRRRAWWLAWPWLGACVAAAPTVLIGFVANRYLVDLLPLLVLPAAVAVVAWRPARVPAARGLAVAALVWGVWANAAFAVWTRELKNPGFTQWRYSLDDTVFGGAPPNVVDLVPGAAVPANGTVAIDGECDGLYIVEDRRWVNLELSAVTRQLVVELPAGDPDSVTTPLWSTAEGTLSAIRLPEPGVAWTPVDGDSIVGHVAEGAVVTALADPVMGTFRVLADGREVLFAYGAPDLSAADLAPGVDRVFPSSSGTPICDALAARR